jgi:hypothetical protein
MSAVLGYSHPSRFALVTSNKAYKEISPSS